MDDVDEGFDVFGVHAGHDAVAEVEDVARASLGGVEVGDSDKPSTPPPREDPGLPPDVKLKRDTPQQDINPYDDPNEKPTVEMPSPTPTVDIELGDPEPPVEESEDSGQDRIDELDARIRQLQQQRLEVEREQKQILEDIEFLELHPEQKADYGLEQLDLATEDEVDEILNDRFESTRQRMQQLDQQLKDAQAELMTLKS